MEGQVAVAELNASYLLGRCNFLLKDRRLARLVRCLGGALR
jgi:hypothetical protein